MIIEILLEGLLELDLADRGKAPETQPRHASDETVMMCENLNQIEPPRGRKDWNNGS